MEFFLGDVPFISLSRADGRSGPPDFPKEQVELIERPGIDGTGLLLLGRRGQPFPCRALTSVGSRQAGLDLLQTFVDAIGADPLPLIWANENLTNQYGVAYQILDVLETAVQPVTAASNGASFLVRATLLLLPVSTS